MLIYEKNTVKYYSKKHADLILHYQESNQVGSIATNYLVVEESTILTSNMSFTVHFQLFRVHVRELVRG